MRYRYAIVIDKLELGPYNFPTMSSRDVIKKYFYFVLKRPGFYWGGIFMLALGAALSRFTPLIYGEIVGNIEKQGSYTYIIFLIGTLLLLKFGSNVVLVIKDVLGDVVLVKAIRDSKIEYIQALQSTDYEYHTNKSSGSLISLAKRGEAAVFTAFGDINNSALIQVFNFIFTVIIMFSLHVQMALIVMAVVLSTLAVSVLLVKRNIGYRKQVNREEDKITGIVVDNLIGFETVKIFATENREKQRLSRAFDPWDRAAFNYFKSFKEIDLSLSFASTLALGLVFWFGLESIQSGAITTAVFVAAMVYVFDLTGGLHQVVYNLRNLAKTHTDLVKYFEVMELKSEIAEAPDAQPLVDVAGRIEFSNVSFKYNKSGSVLKDISLSIEPNQTVALVGESGSGKTTLTKLLMRFYDVNSGSIKIDGHDLRNIRIHDLRRSIGLVPQEPVMFNDTIAYNIAYGRENATQEEIEAAAKKANLHKFIMQLPEGYTTRVGERGIKLSGGQKQRLAIARVILENPEIVIFDEATSQLDSANEKKIQEAFANLTHNKTTVIIAHRLSTIMKADKIVVFDKGHIVETGKHEELLAQNGIYYKLWKLQTETGAAL